MENDLKKEVKIIEKIGINLFEEATEEEYNKKRFEYIANYKTYEPGGLLSMGRYVKNPALGESEWNRLFPNGFESWASDRIKLNAYGEQEVINKINEIIEVINSLLPNNNTKI